MKTLSMMLAGLLSLACLLSLFEVAEAKVNKVSKQDAYQLLKSGNSDVVRSLAPGDKEILLAIMAMNHGKIRKALHVLAAESLKKNRLAALIRAEAYRRQSVQAADRAGHYAHAANDDIGRLKQARISTGLDEANKRLDAFMLQLNNPQIIAVKPVAAKSIKVETVASRSRLLPPTSKQVLPKWKRLKSVNVAVSGKSKPLLASVQESVEQWRTDWESLDSDAYLSHYHPSFKTVKHDYNSWVAYKRRVNGSKSYIHVSLSNMKIIPGSEHMQEGEAVLVTFKQHYESSNYNATSRKQLYLSRRNTDEPWLILYEK